MDPGHPAMPETVLSVWNKILQNTKTLAKPETITIQLRYSFKERGNGKTEGASIQLGWLIDEVQQMRITGGELREGNSWRAENERDKAEMRRMLSRTEIEEKGGGPPLETITVRMGKAPLCAAGNLLLLNCRFLQVT